MKKISELTDFYYKSLYPTLQKLEKDRKNVRDRIIVIGILYTLIAAIIIYYFFDYIMRDFNIFVFIGFAYIGIGGFLYKLLIRNYTDEFKLKIIEPLIQAIDKNLLYNSLSHISQSHFQRSKIYNTSIDRISGNDYVHGSIDDTKIEFSDLHVEKKHKNSKNKDEWETIFKGLFIVCEFNKNFHGRTVVLPDTAQKTFGNLIGNWLQSHNFGRDELVKMDNHEFEEKFVVYSTDQIEARYILTHSLMKRLLAFDRKSDHPVCISFVGDYIHIAIDSKKDFFEPSVFSSLLDYKVAMQYVKNLHLAIGIVEELKLNQKLWSKQ